jgi:hypothetical protein
VLIMETGFAMTAVVALILNLSLPYNIEDDTKAFTETDAHLATFAGSNPEIGSSKEVADVEEKKIDELDI